MPQFDYEQTNSLRLPPLESPEYNAIDSINSQNTIRYGLNNRLQTKRNGQIDDLINWGLYMDWHLQSRSDQTTFSDIYSDFTLKPRSWLIFNSSTRYSIEQGQFNLSQHTLTLQPNNTWNWSIRPSVSAQRPHLRSHRRQPFHQPLLLSVQRELGHPRRALFRRQHRHASRTGLQHLPRPAELDRRADLPRLEQFVQRQRLHRRLHLLLQILPPLQPRRRHRPRRAVGGILSYESRVPSSRFGVHALACPHSKFRICTQIGLTRFD